jgi:hypothetical protein
MNKNVLDPFELLILKYCLRSYADIRDQIASLRIRKRFFFPGGFFVYFDHLSNAKGVLMSDDLSTMPSDWPPHILAKRTSPSVGQVMFTVWVKGDGFIDRLEGSSLEDDKWPQNPYEGFCEFQDDKGVLINLSA